MEPRSAARAALAFVLAGNVLASGSAMQSHAAVQDGLRQRPPARLRESAQQQLQSAPATSASRAAETVTLAGLQVSVWRPADKGPAPLVVFSHGFHGSSTQSAFLMRALADAGYLVVAPNHRDAGMRSGAEGMRSETPFNAPGAWSDKTYKDRADDITNLLHAIKTDPAWAGAVDWSKVALAGHSLGGYTVLGLAGGWPAWKIPEVKAVLALSPYCVPFTQKGKMGAIQVPVMYQGGTRDVGITPSVQRRNGAYDLTPGPAYFVEFDKAGHLAWTDLNPQYQDSIDYYSIVFLNKYLRGDTKADLTTRRPDVVELRAK